MDASNKRTITVGVYGGLVQWIRGIPADVRVVVHDYDVEGADASDLSLDENGDECSRSVWENEDGFLRKAKGDDPMRYCKGTIVTMKQFSGCVELTVAGEAPGWFAIDNACFWAIADCDGPGLIGRAVEYRDGCVRFLDTPEHEEADIYSAVIPFPRPSCPPHRT